MPAADGEFDALVIGSGLSGGMAAKELTERGFKVLMIERGRHVTHGEDYVGEDRPPWDFRFRGLGDRQSYARDYTVQRQARAFGEGSDQFFVRDSEHPYETDPDHPFAWIRGYHLGGRSITWGRATPRLAPINFEEPLRDGHGIDWAIRYEDIAPWYSHVEQFIGVCGEKAGLETVPDGEFLPPMPLNCVEEHVQKVLADGFPGRHLIPERSAILSQNHNDRAACHYCGPCYKGCSTASYYSSIGVSIPAAQATGLLTTVTDAIVAGIDYDPATKRATGVRVIDTKTREKRTYRGRMIFMNASTVGTTKILLQSVSEAWPHGLGNDNDALGRYLLDHAMGAYVAARMPGHLDRQPIGNRPNGIYIPRFANLGEAKADYLRGFGFQGSAWRANWVRGGDGDELGAELKSAMRSPGPWYMHLVGFGETLPNADNRITLSATKQDNWGLPLADIRFNWSENEHKLVKAAAEAGAEMLKAAGGEIVSYVDKPSPGGLAIHEMGGARMGRDPRTSIVNGHNQMHSVPNVFVTDGACMPATGNANPSLTYMALTARAAEYAAGLVKIGAI
jgi:choline dehydrogenase-like flavoprotein